MDKLDNIKAVGVSTAINQAKTVKSDARIVASTKSSSSTNSLNQKAKSTPPINNLSENMAKTLAQTLKINEEKVKEAVKEINNELVKLQSELGFSVDKVANDVVVTVKRKETGEVVRQIPSEAVLKLAHNFEKLKGVLLDELF